MESRGSAALLLNLLLWTDLLQLLLFILFEF